MGFGRRTGIDLEGVSRASAQHAVEAQHLQTPGTKTLVRLRDHFPGHWPGLQPLHHAATGLRHGHAANWGAQHQPHLGLGRIDAVTRQYHALPQPPGLSLGYKPENIEAVR